MTATLRRSSTLDAMAGVCAGRCGSSGALAASKAIPPRTQGLRLPPAAGATATGFDGRQSYAHTSDTSQILPRSWGLAVRELLLAARPKFTGIYVGNGLRFESTHIVVKFCYRPHKVVK
eukprot:COSAG01_NODE_294_length_19294_cov_35.559312_7_plen_119_part_00